VFVVAAGFVRVGEQVVGVAEAGMGTGLLVLGAGFVSGGERGEVVNGSAAGLAGGVGGLPEAVVRARFAVPLAVLAKQREGVPVVLGSLAGSAEAGAGHAPGGQCGCLAGPVSERGRARGPGRCA